MPSPDASAHLYIRLELRICFAPQSFGIYRRATIAWVCRKTYLRLNWLFICMSLSMSDMPDMPAPPPMEPICFMS